VTNRHSTNSSLRERIVEHVFVGDALRRLWQLGIVNVEVLRSEFDAHGYDLVFARAHTVRHIQLKTGLAKRPGDVSVPISLADKPSGCVIWISVTDELDLGPYYWFGGAPGEPLPDVSGYSIPLRATHNKMGVRPSRPNHRLIPKAHFEPLNTIDTLLIKLFGMFPNVQPDRDIAVKANKI
jgi:hypothetical protein